MVDLKTLQCVPCRGDEPRLSEAEIEVLRPQIPEWQILEREAVKQLEREYRFKNFAQALSFTNKVGELAEAEDHHPVLKTEWGKVTVTFWTHAIQGLHQNDFIMAAKTDELYAS
jgi:4a-hydroxytetrahydrobiopterin dehydratase